MVQFTGHFAKTHGFDVLQDRVPANFPSINSGKDRDVFFFFPPSTYGNLLSNTHSGKPAEWVVKDNVILCHGWAYLYIVYRSEVMCK